MGLNSVRISQNYLSSGVSADSFAAVVMNSQGGLISNLTNSTQFDGDSFMEITGGFVNLIETYNLSSISHLLCLNRTFYLPPQEDFYLVKYSIKNTINQKIKVN